MLNIGPELPPELFGNLQYAAAATHPLRKSLLICGGEDNFIDPLSITAKIFELSCQNLENCEWNSLGTYLSSPRAYHVAFLSFERDYTSDQDAVCNKKSCLT